MGERRSAYRVLVGKPEVKRTLRRPCHRWKDNIKVDIQEGEEGMLWTGLIWLRIGKGSGVILSEVKSIRVP